MEYSPSLNLITTKPDVFQFPNRLRLSCKSHSDDTNFRAPLLPDFNICQIEHSKRHQLAATYAVKDDGEIQAITGLPVPGFT